MKWWMIESFYIKALICSKNYTEFNCIEIFFDFSFVRQLNALQRKEKNWRQLCGVRSRWCGVRRSEMWGSPSLPRTRCYLCWIATGHLNRPNRLFGFCIFKLTTSSISTNPSVCIVYIYLFIDASKIFRTSTDSQINPCRPS